jgi:hypothetical protein
MPINLFNNPLASIKLGANNILKGYIGNGQIFPNDAEITAAAFTNANIANTGGNTPYVVSGEIGASFTLTGSVGATAPSGTQVISTSPTTYQIAVGDQSTTCGATSRSSQVVITPQGNTVLASGLSNTDTIIQAAGPATVNNSGIAMTASIIGSGPTVTIGGNLEWSAGAYADVTLNYTSYGSQGQSALSYIQFDCEDDSGNNSVLTPGNISSPYYHTVGSGFSTNGLLRYGINTTNPPYGGSSPATQTYKFRITLNAGQTTRYFLVQMAYGNATCINTTPSPPSTLQKFP